MSSDQFPTPLEIKALAEEYGYAERREEASRTLFFQQTDRSPPDRNAANSPPIQINVFYTTRGIMTRLPHPSSRGYNSLWRASAYDSLETLAMLFENPRVHTGKGYRQAKDATRGCARCGYQKKRGECYSSSQWKLGPGKSICSECVSAAGKSGAAVGEGEKKADEVTTARAGGGGGGGGGGSRASGGKKSGSSGGSGSDKENKENGHDHDDDVDEDGAQFPRLSAEALEAHDRRNTGPKGGGGRQIKKINDLERRQFNCPLCPDEGRGRHVFFKRVPASKPIAKCPRCKRAKKRGECERLYPIPKGEEKGYGLFRCTACKSTWGSSRAVGNIGQLCHSCDAAGNSGVWIKPFRVETYRPSKAGGGGRRMRRVPRETIDESAEAAGGYSPSDQIRFQNGGMNGAMGGRGAGGGVGGGGGAGRSFDWVERDGAGAAPKQETAPAASRLIRYKSLQHKCEGCATGACRSRRLPVSGIHDVHDGDTASTSGSIVTNSEVDKSEFVDRDIDFDEWEEDDGTEVWVTMGKNGKMLRG